eukprot:gene26527-biopygen16761
MSRGCSRP